MSVRSIAVLDDLDCTVILYDMPITAKAVILRQDGLGYLSLVFWLRDDAYSATRPEILLTPLYLSYLLHRLWPSSNPLLLECISILQTPHHERLSQYLFYTACASALSRSFQSVDAYTTLTRWISAPTTDGIQ
jgi:hypothetical protein